MVHSLWDTVLLVREKSPLVHNITNYVVMNNTANALLAIGASPIMAHAHHEVDEMVQICQSLVINIGTLDDYWVASMVQAAQRAQALGKPFVLDPVGAGATRYRDQTLDQLLVHKPTVIRGNASEIMALAKSQISKTKGVDSTAQSMEAIDAAYQLHHTYGSIVCISGATDIIVSNDARIEINNGDPLMTKVTGLGCTATAIIGACIAVEENTLHAAAAGVALLSIAGELAAKTANGPGSLQMQVLDKLYTITESEFKQHLNALTIA